MQGAANIIREFETQSALRPDAKTKLLHIPMSFHLRDRELMERDGQAIVKEWLRRMEAYGFRFDQYIVVRHHDQDHKNPHFHLVINTTLCDGSAVKTSYIGKYAKMASMEVTRNWAMVATYNRTQRNELSIAQPGTAQSATSESARPATPYMANDTTSTDAPTG
ncbi:MAG: relaxase/mobilization nuclease domain-containing protein [Alistipes sp.]|nr:relaxase/mobilization nuclease domain-containing protein [Alistipes sp.]